MSFFVATSLISSVIVVGVGLFLTGYHFMYVRKNGIDPTVNYMDFSHIGQYFGVIYFSLGEIGLVFPIRHTMKHPRSYKPAFMSTITIATIFYMVFGIYGCLAHGDTQNEIILFIYDKTMPIIYACGYLYSIVGFPLLRVYSFRTL